MDGQGNAVPHQPETIALNISDVAAPPCYTPSATPVPMPAPQRPLGCPPGLEYLTQIDQLLIHQEVELAKVLLGVESNNKYQVKNSLGQQVFHVVEEQNCCNKNLSGLMRSFVLHIQDNFGKEVATLTRPLRCSFCCCPCCLQELEVQAPPGTAVGYVVQDWHPFLPKFSIQNERRERVLTVVGPFCTFAGFGGVSFEVLSLEESTKVGRIAKQQMGPLWEIYTNSDKFKVQFPLNLDVRIKAVMLGACFLIDFMFFEHDQFPLSISP